MDKILKLCLLIPFFLGTADRTQAENGNNNFSFEHLTINEGLSQNFVNRILQDKQGFIWIGTRDGLNRYDGNEIRVYKHDPVLPNSISGNDIKDMLESVYGDLWIVADGISLYNRDEDDFDIIIPDNNSKLNFPPEDITLICEDQTGNIWVAVDRIGLYHICKNPDSTNPANKNTDDDSSASFKIVGPYSVTPESEGTVRQGRYLDISVDSRNNLWVATQSGLSLLSANASDEYPDPEQAVFKDMDTEDRIKSEPQTCIYEDIHNNVWIGTHSGLIKYSNQKKKKDNYQFYDYPENFFKESWEGSVSDIKENENGIFWIGTLGGLVMFDPEDNSFDKVVNIPDNDASLGFDNIRCIYRDNGNIMWLGTGGMGIDKYRINYKSFAHYMGKSYDGTVYSTYSIIKDQLGVIWFTNNDGVIFQFDPKLKRLNRFVLDQSTPTKANDMGINHQGDIYISENNSMYRQKASSGKLEKFNLWEGKNLYNPSDSVTVIHIDHDDQVWLCNAGNLFHFDENNRKFTRYRIRFDNLKKVNTLFRDINGIFWIGTMKGLIRYDIVNGNQDLIDKSQDAKLQLNINQINDIEPDPDSGLLWIATGGGGILCLNRNTFELRRFTIENGLANNFVYCILSDGKGSLWMSTNHGLSKFDPVTEKFTNYTVTDGLQSNEFNSYAKHKSASGELFFGGINGITAFYPNQIRSNPNVPQIVITDFALFYESINQYKSGSPLIKAINVTEKIELSHDQNNISFHFAALDFYEPDGNQYRYKLQNFDDNWIEAGTNGFASYTNLRPGSYVFEVKGSNNDGIWNTQSKQIQIAILPSFWNTWWAYLIYGLLFISAAYLIHRYQRDRIALKEQLKYEKREIQKLAELDEFKSNFFTGVSHELRTPLTLIKGNLEDLTMDSGIEVFKRKINSAKKHSNQLLFLINQILDVSRLESLKWETNYSYLDVVEFIKDIVQSFSPIAEQKDLCLEFQSDKDRYFMDVDPDALQKVIQNLLSNATKFSPNDKTVRVTINFPENMGSLQGVQNADHYIRISVIDHGIGIDEKNLPYIFNRFYQIDPGKTGKNSGFGVGLWLCKKLMDIQNGRIDVSSNPGEGSTFSIELPVTHKMKNRHDGSESDFFYIPKSEEKLTNAEIDLISSESVITGASENPENTVLIVEDHNELRRYLNEILINEFLIIQASNGKEGLNKAISHIPDIIISDIMMPEMNGYEMATKITGDLRTSHIPVLFLTAKSSESDMLKALELGINDYLIKPFKKEELLLRLKNLISLRDRIKYRVQQDGLFSFDSPDKPEFIITLNQLIEKNIENTQLGVALLCKEMGMTRVQLHRKLKAISNITAIQMIQNARLFYAQKLLKQGCRVSETAYRVGYGSPAHFSKIFKEKFGYTPKAYSES